MATLAVLADDLPVFRRVLVVVAPEAAIDVGVPAIADVGTERHAHGREDIGAMQLRQDASRCRDRLAVDGAGPADADSDIT